MRSPAAASRAEELLLLWLKRVESLTLQACPRTPLRSPAAASRAEAPPPCSAGERGRGGGRAALVCGGCDGCVARLRARCGRARRPWWAGSSAGSAVNPEFPRRHGCRKRAGRDGQSGIAGRFSAPESLRLEMGGFAPQGSWWAGTWGMGVARDQS